MKMCSWCVRIKVGEIGLGQFLRKFYSSSSSMIWRAMS